MPEDHIDIKFTADGIRYEAQAWPDEDYEKKPFFQVTFFNEEQPEEPRVIYLDNPEDGKWVQRVEEDGEKMMSASFIGELGRHIDLLYSTQTGWQAS